MNYHIGKNCLAHVYWMRALLGENGKSHYPGFSEEPLAGFEDLRQDLVEHCSDFISGNGEQFCLSIQKHKEYESLTGFQKMETNQSRN